MKDVTVIIPVGTTMTDADYALLKNAVKSVDKKCHEIIVIGTSDLASHEEELKKVNKKVKVVANETPSYSNNVNKAVDMVSTEYFSVLEFDDTFSKNWFKNVEDYENYDSEDKFAYLPLTEIVDFNTKETIGYANEAFWASSFSDEIGYMDKQSLELYLGFNMSGAVLRKKDFQQVGGLKESMKLSFWYEFLFRALHKEKNIFVVPKIGCFHLINRPGCLTDTYAKEMSEKEAEWWVELAKKEYFFPQDRKKVYEEE